MMEISPRLWVWLFLAWGAYVALRHWWGLRREQAIEEAVLNYRMYSGMGDTVHAEEWRKKLERRTGMRVG